MKQLYRRFVAMILVVAMGLTMLPMEAFAEAYSDATQINLPLADGSVPIKIQKLDENGEPDGEPTSGSVNAGDVSTTAPPVEGYDFLYAKVNNSEVSYLGSYNGQTYYSDSDNNAVLLIVPEGTTPVFYYEPHVEVYSVEYSLNDTAGAAYDGPKTVRADTPLNFQVSTPRGCETTVTYTMGSQSQTLTETSKSSTPDGDTLIYEIEQVTSNVRIEIDVNEIETFRYGMDSAFATSSEGWPKYGHGATFKPADGTFSRGKGFTWTLTGDTSENVYWIMNGLEINGEDLSIPFSQGEPTTTTLSTGTVVKIAWTKTNSNNGVKYNTYTITVSNAYEDIYITGGNFRASGHKEVMPTLISPGVNAQWRSQDSNWQWKDAISSTPIGFGSGNYVKIRYQLEPGYENLQATVDGKTNSTRPDGEGWYNITIYASQVDSSRGFADVQITCDLAEYTVSYTGGEQPAAENLPSDNQQYDVVNNTQIYIPSNIPTADGEVFQGWSVNGGTTTYRPAAQVSLTDVLESADDNNQITFTAIWKSVQESKYVTYTINLYLDGQTEPVGTYRGQGIDGTQLLVRSQDGSWIAEQLEKYPDYELPVNFTNTITLNKNVENTVEITLVRKTYTVTYDANGGTGAMDPDTVKSGDDYTVKGNDFTWTGYEFTGWNTRRDGTGTGYSENTTIADVRENITLYAQWEQTVFPGTPITVVVIKDGKPVTASEYVDVYEYTGGGGTEAFKATPVGDNIQVTYEYYNLNCADIKLDVIADITGYSVTVTSNPSGSTTGVVDDSVTVACEIIGSGASWSLDNVPGGAVVTVTLEKLEYTVNYIASPAEGGSVTLESETVVHGGNGIGSTAQAKDGYYFTNWTDESGKVVSEDAKFVPQNVTGNATYTANFAQQTAITVKATDLTKPYDGDALAANDTYELTGDLAKGHRLVVTTKVSKDIINVTDKDGKHQIESVRVVDGENNDVTYLYDITYAEGDLTITPITITLTSGDYSWPYDGQSHSYPEVKVEGSFAKDEGFATGDDGKPLFTNFATVQSEGESKDNTFNYTLKEGTSEDNYNIVVEPGTISISNSYDVTYVFQGETPEGAIAPEGENYLAPERKHTVESYPQVPEGYTFDGWYVGETMYEPGKEITIVDQDITLVGKWTKLYTVTYDGNAPEGTTVDISGEAYQAAYYDDGQTVTLAPAPAAPDGYTFAGWEIVDSAAAITENSFTMPAQDVIVRATWTKRSDLSYTVNHYLVGTTLKVKDSETVPNQVFLDVVQVSAGAVLQGYELQGNDTQTITIQVTGNEVTFYYYKLATVKADDQEMTYGGTVPPLTAAVTGLYGSDEATKITYNTPTTTATSTSPVDNYPIEVTGNAIQGYYKVTYVPGELIIKPATMNLTVKGYDDFYDGAAHGGTVSGYPEGATLQYSTDNGSTWKEEEPTVTDYTENPVAVQVKVTLANYDEVIREYTLNVKKRPVTLVSEGATREYNGEALTNANWHYEGEYEFVNGEVTEISTIGTQTEIGSSKNTIAYKKTAEFDEGNYIITLKEGYLVVTPPQNPNEYDVVTKTHDKNNLNPGEIVTFTITVKNIFADTATVTLNELPGVNFSENGTNKLTFQLNGGETKEVKATYTITEADVLAGKFVNTVSATLVVGGQTVEASATDTVTLKAAPALTVDKTVTSRPTNGSTYALDETITWSITVTNSGNVTLKDIKVSDSLTYQGDESGNKLSGTLTPPAGFDGNLDRGESVTYTYSYQVTEADLGKTLVNTATATGKDSNDKDAEPDSDEADPVRTDDLKPSLSVTKTADRETAAVGETINYTITVTNNGNQTLNSIKVTDPLTGLNQEISTLKPGEASEAFKTSYTVKVSDLIAGSVVNTATAEAGNVTAEVRKTVAITGSLNISVTLNSGEFTYDGQEHTVSGIKSVIYGNDVISVNNGTFKIGDTTFTLSCAENTATATGTNVVRNPDGTVGSYPVTAQPTDITVKMGGQNVTGKVTVTNVIAGSLQINPRKVTITVQDAEKTYGESDPTPFQAVLSGDPLVNDTDLGTITCSRTNKDEDAGVYEDVLTAACETNENYDVIVVNGDFTIKKYTLPVVVTIEGTSAEKPYTGSEQSVEGYMITGITVNGVESELYPEASVQFVGEPYDKVASGTYVGEYSMALNKDDFENGNANFTNVTFQVTPGKLTITPGTYQPVTKTHEKKQDGSDLFALNETVTFPITVVNIYNTPAKVTLKEQEGVFFEGGSQTAEQVLGPGDKMIFNAYYVITEQDILNESFTNTVEWTIARIDDSEKITGTAADTVEVVAKAPKLTVSKAVKNSGDAPFDLDETITYTITVKNDGNVTVTGINVADLVTTEGENRQAATVNTEAFALKPGEDKSFEYTYKVQQSDLGKTILNTATATGSDPTGEEVVGTDDVEAETEERNPELDVTKVASKPANGAEFVLDETITYTITVKNTGNVTLADIFVSDEFSRDDGATWDVQKDKLTPSASTPITLEPGEQKIYTYQYTVVEEDLGKTLKNTATATAPNPDDPSQSVTDGATTPGEKVEDPKPDLSVTKEVVNKQTSYRVGDVITYQITVTNTGNTTIHNVELMDQMNAHGKVTFKDLGDGQMVGGSPVLAALAPKTAWVVTCQYTVQLADADSDGTTIYNKVTVNADDGPDGKDPEDQTPGEDIDPIYTLTIKYQNGARVDLRNPDTVKLHAGDVYTVVAPGINGYHLSDKADAKFDFTMRDRDTTIVIIYAANPVEDDDDDPVVNPDNDPDETTEETEDEVDPGVYIEDPDDYTLTPITEEETPLADLDVGDHTCCIMHFLLMLAAMVVLGFYTDSKKKHQARIFELKRTLAMEKGKNPDGDNSQQS